MKQQVKDYRDYGDRIYRELKNKYPEKYKHITKESITNHIWHINYSLSAIICKEYVEFVSPFFDLAKGFRRYFKHNSKHVQRVMQRNYHNARQKELADRVINDNVCDNIRIISCVVKTDYKGNTHIEDAHNYKWNRLSPYLGWEKSQK